MKLDLNYFLARLKEPGTWRLFGSVAALFGVTVTDGVIENAFAVVSAGLALWESAHMGATAAVKAADAAK